MDINFDSIEFYAKAKILGIIYYQILIKSHWLIEKIEKYYIPIYQVYNIIQVEKKYIIFKNIILQIAFKAVNDSAGFNNLVLTLLVFHTYSCIVINFLSLTF